MHYEESSQATKWQLSSQVELNTLREHANKRARDVLSREDNSSSDDVKMDDSATNNESSQSTKDACEVYGFDETRGERSKETKNLEDDNTQQQQLMMLESDPEYGPTHTSKSRGNNPLLTPADEALLISFYCSKIPLLIGPHATLSRCKRDAKVAATACLLFRRFYLSNSVMMHDPKSMLAAAAFLATKVEDCMILIGYLEMGTKEMNAPVPLNDILDAEIKLIQGIDFDLLVFSPYKTVLSYTEDLRTFLKTEKGRGLITFPPGQEDGDGGGEQKRQLVGEDLRPMHDEAIQICDDVIVSDIPLCFAPGEVGLAALMIANEYVSSSSSNSNGEVSCDGTTTEVSENSTSPQIDIMGYIRLRFQDSTDSKVKVDKAAIDAVTRRVSKLGQMIRELREGKHGCGNHNVDMEKLKSLNKKLKKCRAWGASEKKESKKKKKSKKRKADDDA